MTKELFYRITKQIETDIFDKDFTAIEELLNFIPIENLIQFLPEEEWDFYRSLEKITEVEISEDEEGYKVVYNEYFKYGFFDTETEAIEFIEENGWKVKH